MSTFATTTINKSASAITSIEQQIAQLQEQLTALQEQQQAIKSAEQQGLSAISQFKQAIATIAQLEEPEMLQQFLEEMATITNQAVGAPQLPASPDDDDDDSVTPSLDDDGDDDSVTLALDDDSDEPSLTLTQPDVDVSSLYARFKLAELKSYAANHGIKTSKMNKAEVAAALYAAGYYPGQINNA